ncbi:MAG: GTPase Era [Chitinophagaceae bacterium]|nr:MAG: GTPase Era [Chitinophagaceae bacterium]
MAKAKGSFTGKYLAPSPKKRVVVVLNKIDAVKDDATIARTRSFFEAQPYCKEVVLVSALKATGVDELLQRILHYLPEGHPFYEGDDMSDLPTKFFVSELIREKVYQLYQEELPYHTAVLVREFKEKTTLIKISADIIVQRDTQKGIILGDKGSMIKKLGTLARVDIEAFLGSKVFLELFVKVRPKWRDNETHLKEYGY